MTMLSIISSVNAHGLTFHPPKAPVQNVLPILSLDPEGVTNLALQALGKAGIVPTEWGALVYAKMNVPVPVKNFSYIIPDDQLELASSILQDMGLLLCKPETIYVRTGGQICTVGRRHRITKWTSLCDAQFLVLFPASFIPLFDEELETRTIHDIEIRTPRPAAVYACLLRLIGRYRHPDPARSTFAVELNQLILYDMLKYDGYWVNDDELDEFQVIEEERIVAEAVGRVREWQSSGIWDKKEGWMADALVQLVDGTGRLEHFPQPA
ncbi:hypothetical protein C8J56DRAFT_538187 [Mycena floridula]|nr:hypothetical protein C8J56DRAFT_538187 [Mycena floridula]